MTEYKVQSLNKCTFRFYRSRGSLDHPNDCQLLSEVLKLGGVHGKVFHRSCHIR